MDRNTFLKKAAEYFDISEDLMEAIADVETLTEDEALAKYGKQLEKINQWAEEIGPHWVQEVKEWIKGKENVTRNMKIQITESDIQNMVTRCTKMLAENMFSNSLDKVRVKYYIQGKRKGLDGDKLDQYAQDKMSDFMAKNQALMDFKKDLRKEHPNHLEDDEFYGNSETMADTWGFEEDPYIDEED